jgi:hypothetical protein
VLRWQQLLLLLGLLLVAALLLLVGVLLLQRPQRLLRVLSGLTLDLYCLPPALQVQLQVQLTLLRQLATKQFALRRSCLIGRVKQ